MVEKKGKDLDKISKAREILDTLVSVSMENHYEQYNLANVCYLIESGNGFESTDNSNLPAKLMLVITEIIEARQYCYNPEEKSNEPLGEELADVCIRLYAMIYSYSMINEVVVEFSENISFNTSLELRYLENSSLEYKLFFIIDKLSEAMEWYRHNNHTGVVVCMTQALNRTIYLSNNIFNVDLFTNIFMKCRKNMKRLYLHGKVSTK